MNTKAKYIDRFVEYEKDKSIVYHKIALVENKGNKDYSPCEKQMIISLINDYSLFGALDNEMVECLLKREQEHILYFSIV